MANKEIGNFNNETFEESSILEGFGNSHKKEILDNFKSHFDINSENFVPKQVFEDFYLKYFKFASLEEMKALFDVDEEGLKMLKDKLEKNEKKFFGKDSPFRISHFLIHKQDGVIGGSYTIAMKVEDGFSHSDRSSEHLFNIALAGIGSSSSSQKGGLNYYDNRRDIDGQYQGKYGKFNND